jgi:hypothetical protein
MVGLVELGSTLGSPAALMMSGAWPPPAPSVWKVWMVRPLKAAAVVSTKPASSVGVDSVRVPYPVEQKLTKWERVKMDFGTAAIVIAALAIMAGIVLVVWRIRGDLR